MPTPPFPETHTMTVHLDCTVTPRKDITVRQGDSVLFCNSPSVTQSDWYFSDGFSPPKLTVKGSGASEKVAIGEAQGSYNYTVNLGRGQGPGEPFGSGQIKVGGGPEDE